MAKNMMKLNTKEQAWIHARQRFHLSHTQVQMARELGMNPRTLGKLNNHDQEPWKMLLKRYIEHLYLKRFGRETPDVVLPIEELVRRRKQKKARLREEELQCRQIEATDQAQCEVSDP